jgi:hypothetical protein
LFNPTKIQDKLFGIVGFRNPANPDYQIVDAANQESRSGYYADDNEFVKIETIKDCQDYDNISDADFNIKLSQIQRSAISSVCNSIFRMPEYRDRNLLYRNAQNKVNVEALSNGFIGYKLTLDDTKNLAINISRVLCDFQGTGTIELYLFNSSVLDPIKTETINITSDRQEVSLNWTIDNTDLDYKGEYYIGYNTTGLTVAPYKRDYNNSSLKSGFSNLCVEDVFVPNHNTNTLFDLTKQEGNSLATGLNLDITVYDDYTDLIINNENLFGYAIYLDMVLKILSLYTGSIRSNKNQRIANQNVTRIYQEIEGQSGDGLVTITGVRPMLLGEIERLTGEIKKLKRGYFGDGIMIDTLI